MDPSEPVSRLPGPISPSAIRFVLVGLLNTGFSYGVYCGFLYLGAPYQVASFVALVMGVIWSFVTSGRLVFRRRLQGRFHKYLVVWAALYLVNILLIALLTGLGMNAYIAGFFALAPIVVMAFFLQKKYVFAD